MSRDYVVAHFSKQLNLTISYEFLTCADQQLTSIFEKITGIRCNSRTGFAPDYLDEFKYTPGAISIMSMRTYINHNWNPGTIAWKSKSGRIYKIDDVDIECNDIIFWFDAINVPLIRKQMYPARKPFSFRLPKLSYELVAHSGVLKEVVFDFTVSKPSLSQIPSIPALIDPYFDEHQRHMEQTAAEEGTLGQWSWEINDDHLNLSIDLGATDDRFLKKFLIYLSSLNLFTRVEIN